MAQKVVLVDDLDGSAADETVTFAVDGSVYEIDLSKKHAKELRAAVARYVEAARPVRPASAPPKNRKPANSSPRAIREWAKAQGLAVPAKGRIPRAVEDQYAAAN